MKSKIVYIYIFTFQAVNGSTANFWNVAINTIQL